MFKFLLVSLLEFISSAQRFGKESSEVVPSYLVFGKEKLKETGIMEEWFKSDHYMRCTIIN